MYSEQTLENIRTRIDLVELVGEYVELKKAGMSYKGLCPIHGEKTPSFCVQPLKQIFHCFGCHKGGNCFTFLILMEGLSFRDAVQKLAGRAGVTLEEDTKFVPKAREAKPLSLPNEDRILQALEWAAKYFHYLLMEIPEYAPVKEYCKNRGLSDKTLQKFRMGVSPKSWNTLMNVMMKKGFSFNELLEAGLISQRDGKENEGYDRFRNRLMFPILNRDGKVVGFGARQLTEEKDQPKYLNSADSALFSKGRILYGLSENQRHIRLRGEAILVEGYMDVVGLSEKGVNNAIAIMGTALTEEHCLQLKGLTNKVITVFDPDNAGTDAWHRSVHLFMEHKIFARDLSLPNNLDPDEYVQSEGADAFYEACRGAPRQITKYLKEISAKGAPSEDESAKYLAQLTPILVASRNLPDRATLWDDICLVFRISREALRELAEGGIRRTQGNNPSLHSTQTARLPVRHPATVKRTPYSLDREFFQACVRWPEYFLEAPKEIWRKALKLDDVRQWLEVLSKATSIEEFEKLLESQINIHSSTGSPLVALASEGLFEKSPTSEGNTMFNAIFSRLRHNANEVDVKSVAMQIKLAQRMGDETEVLRLLEKLKELRTS